MQAKQTSMDRFLVRQRPSEPETSSSAAQTKERNNPRKTAT